MESDCDIHIYSKSIHDLTSAELAWCRRAMFANGGMSDKFPVYLRYHFPARAVFAIVDGQRRGWGFLWAGNKNQYENIYIFVQNRYRRQGLGTRILKHSLRFTKAKPTVFAHDQRSLKFYSCFDQEKISVEVTV